MPPSNADFYRRMLRGVLLTHLYTAWAEGLNDPSDPRRMGRVVLETSLSARAAMPPKEDLCRQLDWLEGSGYIEVDWGMDDRREYESVRLTQKAIGLYENKRAAQVEPGIALPPRR